jgi:hypothetical protein
MGTRISVTGETTKQRNDRKAKWLEENGGLCAVCHTGTFCPACYYNLPHRGCLRQPVNTYDHHHNRGTTHQGCKGCAKCFRGVTHVVCNRAFLPIAERSPHLQSDYIKAYLALGKVEDSPTTKPKETTA